MNINEFKEGDIITRIEPCKSSYGEDGSYCGERITFLGTDKKIIFFKSDAVGLDNDILDLSFARDKWDEGWDYYPETLFQKLKQKYLKVVGQSQKKPFPLNS